MPRLGSKYLTGTENSQSKIFCWTRVTRIFQKSVFTENTCFSPLLDLSEAQLVSRKYMSLYVAAALSALRGEADMPRPPKRYPSDAIDPKRTLRGLKSRSAAVEAWYHPSIA